MEDLSLDTIGHCMPPCANLARSMGCSVAASMMPSFSESEACWRMEYDAETAAVAQLRGLEASAKQVGSPTLCQPGSMHTWNMMMH